MYTWGMDIQKDKLTIQEAAEATGLSAHTLRYYERIGLIHPIDREENTRRLYTTDDLGWINFLMKMRATGMSIREMQRYAQLQRMGDDTLPDRVEMLKALREQVEARIGELNENMRLVCYKIEIYSEMIEEQRLKASKRRNK
jgi:DNA-binding transcriptional MerR regulator